MDRRPQSKETEEDLLKQQAEFLLSAKTPSAKILHQDKRGADYNNDSQLNAEKRFKGLKNVADSQNVSQGTNDSDVHSNLLLDVLEHETTNAVIVAPRPQNNAFPAVLRISNVIHGGEGRSLFARHASSLKSSDTRTLKKLHIENDHHPFGNQSVILDGGSFEDKTVIEEIHRENVQKLGRMNEEEILREKNELMKSIDPALIEFLKRKRQKQFDPKTLSAKHDEQKNDCNFQKNSSNEAVPDKDHETKMEISDELLDKCLQNNDSELNENNSIDDNVDIDGKINEDNLPIKPDEAKKWLHMDYVEHEKLQWIMDVPSTKDEKIQSGYSARFDFDGVLLSRNEEIPTFVGLHHHAEEPDMPGYTLEELLQYSRSSVSQQRMLGLRILTNVIKKSNTGIYDEYLESSILPQLIDAGILLMLRWSIDDDIEAVREVAIQALNAILVIPADEVCLDRTFFWYRGYEMPFLKLHDEFKGNDEGTAEKDDKELTDAELLKMDAVNGLLRIDILLRFQYILKKYHPPPPCVISILEILIRIARHSLESASAVFRSGNLIQLIINNFIPKHWIHSAGKTVSNAYGVPVPEAVKLIRILASAGRTIAKTLITQYKIMDTIISYILLEPSDDRLPLTETLRLILESFSTWKVFLSHGFCSEYYVDIFPLIMEKLQHCQQISLVEMKNPNDFEFKYYSGLFSILESIVQIASFHLNPSNCNNLANVDMSCIPPPVTWQQVSALAQPIFMCVEKWLFELTIGGELSSSALEMLAAALTFLSSFYSQMTLLPSFQIVDSLVHFESFWSKVLIPFLQCQNWRKIVNCLIKYSNLLSRKKSGTLRDSLSLATLGSLLWGGSFSPVLEVDGTVQFLTPLLKFVITIMKLHKHLDEKVATLILCEEVINEYIKRLISVDHRLAVNWFSRYETHFIYYFLKLNVMKSQSDAFLSHHHHLAIHFLSLVCAGDEHLLKDIMKTVIFNPIYFKNENIIAHFSSLSFGETSSEQTHTSLDKLNIQEVLPRMMELYLDVWETNCKLNKETSEKLCKYSKLVIKRKSETLLPVDWMFLPIKLTFLNKFQYNLDDIQHCLKWLCILYNWRRDALKNIQILNYFCYLACIFLIGKDDTFKENKVRPYLEELAAFLVQTEKKEKLNMKNPVPVAKCFRDFYLQLLTQFEAVSYGDHLFGLFILLPLQQRYDEQLRIDLWTSHTISLRLLSMTIPMFPVSLQCYLNPVECNKQLLISYYQNVLSNTVNPKCCPILYLIAVHHLHHFLYGKTEIHKKMKVAMLNNFDHSKNEVVKNHIRCYGGMDSNSYLGFGVIS